MKTNCDERCKGHFDKCKTLSFSICAEDARISIGFRGPNSAVFMPRYQHRFPSYIVPSHKRISCEYFCGIFIYVNIYQALITKKEHWVKRWNITQSTHALCALIKKKHEILQGKQMRIWEFPFCAYFIYILFYYNSFITCYRG